MWVCYLRFDDQGQPVTYHIGCPTQANVDELVRLAGKHGLTRTARLVEHARFYSSRTIYPKAVPPGQWYDWWVFLDQWEEQDSATKLVLVDRDTTPEPFITGQNQRRWYRFPQGLVVCCNNLALAEVQGQVCACLVRTDIGQPGWAKREEIGKELIKVIVRQRWRSDVAETTLSALLARVL